MRPSLYPDLDDYNTEEDEDESPSNGLRQRGTVRHENDTTKRDSPDYGLGTSGTNGDVTDDPESIVLPPPIDLRRWSTARSEVDTTMHNSPSYSLNTNDTTEGVTGFHDSQSIELLPPLDLGLDYLTEEDEVPDNSPRRGGTTTDDATTSASTETELDTTMHDATVATSPAARPTTIPSPPNTAANLDFSILGAQERYDAYEDLFKRDLPISQIDFPLQTHAFPELKDEIIEAYLDFTTFVFTILTNYDAACERFYTDEKEYNVDRHADCGKIQLSPRQRTHLQELNVDEIAFKNVRLDICSHWTKLAEVTLEVRPGSPTSELIHIDSFVNQMMKTDSSALEIFIDNTAHQIADAEQDTTNGKLGFHMKDLEAVAKLFVMQQSKAAKEATKRKYSNNGTWEEYDKADANRGYAERLTCYSERTGGYSFGSRTWNSGTAGGALFGSRIRW
ncbi:hypothetical protein LTR17_010059 [Elasticomyces elasticus]|nr:hypothetical protein LTR17_010059 [Elasticomyces elasticus]